MSTVKFEKKGDTLVIRLYGSLAGAEVSDTKERICKELEDSQKAIFDLSEVPFADEFGMEMLLSLYKKQGKLLLFGLSKRLEDKIEILKLCQIFQIFKTEQEAIDSLAV